MEKSPSSPRTPCCFCFWSAENGEDQSRNGGIGKVEMLSDASTFSVTEQERRLKKAVKEEERLGREAESVLKWVKQESARMDVSPLHLHQK